MVSICRLCASLKKTENLTFIRDNNHDLCQKLSKCCHLCIDVQDCLPKGVCPECIRSLNLSFEFIERVHESQQSLRKLLNVESPETDTNSNDDAEQKSVALIAAAANAEKEELINDSNDSIDSCDAVVTVNENDTDEVAQVIKEILGVKGDQAASYLILESDVEDDPPKTEFIEEKDQDDVNPDEMLSTDTYPVIEFINEEEEEIDFEGEQFEIIEGADFEDATQLVQEWKYEIQDVEQLIDEAAKPANSPPPVIETVQKTWTDYPWKCVRCLYVCCTANQLIEHNEKIHFVRATDMEWLCADCQKTFPRYYSLINHIRSRHHSELNLLCDICNESSNSFKDMEKHRQKMHQDEHNLIMLLCVACGKGFYTPNSLQIHSKCHLPDEERLRFACNMCDKKFRTSSNLKFHIKMHTGTRDYVCDQCGKKFVQRANLEEHLVSHINFTPYECSICSKLFKTPERLTRHKLRHTDEKPFSCTVCDRTFRTKDAMLTHTRIHTGEMPFSCEFCEKPFRFRSTLMTHHNVHTGTRPYSCLDCNHHFTNWPNYNKHMKRRHGIDVSSKNPRGTKPSNPPKPLRQPKNPKIATTKSHSMVKRARNQDIREEDVEEDDANVVNVAVEYEPDGDINITVPKQEEEKPDDNYEDAI